MLNLTELVGFGAGGESTLAQLAYTGPIISTSANNTSYTFSAESIGAAPTGASTRRVYVIAQGTDDASGATLDSVTIGGVSATLHIAEGNNNNRSIPMGIASAELNSGTTADIVCNYSTGLNGAAICICSFYDLIETESSTASNSSGSTSGGVLTTSGSIVVPTNGIIIIGAGMYDGTTLTGTEDIAFSQGTEYADGSYYDSNRYAQIAYAITDKLPGGYTGTLSMTPTPDRDYRCIVAVAVK